MSNLPWEGWNVPEGTESPEWASTVVAVPVDVLYDALWRAAVKNGGDPHEIARTEIRDLTIRYPTSEKPVWMKGAGESSGE